MIKRYDAMEGYGLRGWLKEEAGGMVVMYDDHLAVVQKLEERVRELGADLQKQRDGYYKAFELGEGQGFRAGYAEGLADGASGRIYD